MKILTLGVLLSAASSVAAATAPSQTSEIETITVTAHRLPTAAPVLPTIERDPNGCVRVGADALRDLPGFAINQSGSLGTLTQVRVRGSEANHLLVLLDGIDIMDPTTDAGFNFANLNLAGVGRVEYLPGAQSAIWGSDAVAGVLQLTTRPAGRIRRAAIEGGSFDTRSGVVQLADEAGAGYYNLSASEYRTDGTNISRDGSEDDGYRNRSAMASAGTEGETWAVRGLLRHVRTRSDFDPTSFVTGRPEDGDRQNRHEETLAAVSADLFDADRRWQQRFTASWFDTGNRTLSDGARTAKTEGERWKLSSVTGFAIDQRQHLALVVEHERERFAQRGETSFFGDPNQSQRFESTSAGIEYRIDPTERLRLSASARHDRNSDFDDAESFRLAGSYALTDRDRVWIAAGTGIKHPSFVERFGFTPDSFIGNPDLTPEENRHLSAGYEHRTDAWRAAVTVFRDRLEDEINGFFFDPAAGGFTAVNRDGTSRRHGAELELSRRWQNTEVRAGMSYLDAEEPDGVREIRRPEWLAYLSLDQQWSRLQLGIDAYRVGRQIDLDFASFPAERVSLDAYTLLGARVRVPLAGGADVTLRGSNLLDEDYEDQLGYRAPGRALYLELGLDF
ncbi:MAG: TonB-dependent receptor [Pseudomonadales bacterium]